MTMQHHGEGQNGAIRVAHSCAAGTPGHSRAVWAQGAGFLRAGLLCNLVPGGEESTGTGNGCCSHRAAYLIPQGRWGIDSLPPPPRDGVFSGIVVNVGVYPPIFTSSTRLIFMFYFFSPVPETGLMVRPGGIGQHGNLFDL